MRPSKTKPIIFLSLLTALALVISLIEQMFPLPLPVPGAKLGLSNVIILTTVVVFGGKAAFTVAVLKSFLLMLITGSVTGFFYSLAGSVLSSLMMTWACACFMPPLSLVGVSELGALAHNFGQILVAALVMENKAIFYYLPVLTLIGIATAFFVGLAANQLSPHLNRVFHTK